MIKEIFDEIKDLIVWAIIIIVALLIGASWSRAADTIYLLSTETTIVDAEGNKSTVPAFMSEFDLSVGYFRCGTYNEQYIYNVLCMANDCDKLRQSAYFLGNTEVELALEKPNVAKALSDVTYEVDVVDLETGKVIKVQKKVKYSEWEKLGKPKILKRIDKPIEWQ
uniref:Uncharacterized protein n=1 Tax=viral metagenome TaxID=1070528 RepID=A0A6M3IHW0_9ZZZZ